MKHPPPFESATTVPCSSSLSSSIASEVLEEAKAAVSQLPAGEWRRSVKLRLTEIESDVETWSTSEPTTDARKQVTAQALDLFSEILTEQEVAKIE